MSRRWTRWQSGGDLLRLRLPSRCGKGFGRYRRYLPRMLWTRNVMDLSLSDKHRALQDEVRAFIREHGGKSPKLGGGRKRPDQKALDWQKLLVDHGYVARTIPREYGGSGAEPRGM